MEYDNDKNHIEIVKKAYEFAEKVHKGTKRASGELFIEHPLSVAYMLCELKLDSSTIAAALLHDVVEDTSTDLDEIKKEFGEEIAMLVDGVTKISQIKFESKEQRDYEDIRRMLLATTKDIRILMIKLADKLHNMKTLSYLTPEQQKRIAEETLEIYAPLAYRLGIANIKWELEDLSFKYLKPKTYKKFKEKFGKKRIQRELEVMKVKSIIEKELKKNGIKTKIVGRPKHFYSIYKKMITKKRSFEELYDLIGLRIIADSVKDCYEILGLIHSLWKPIPYEFDDYIAMPKSNMYQSLHTAVVGSRGEPIEIQIRTEKMHSVAEEGIASHWKYKGFYEDKHIDKKLSWLKQILEWQRESKDTKDFLEFLKVDFFEDEIYVFTPKGKLITLPRGSTPIDFAYQIHSSVGERCTGAIVDGRIVPLRHGLQNGNIVKILTSKDPKPKRDWLKIVKTNKAKNKIKAFLKNIEHIQVNIPKDIIREERGTNGYLIKFKDGIKPDVTFAKCCNPLPWDKIVGYLKKTDEVIIHKVGCENLKKVTSKKRVKVDWSDEFIDNVKIKITGGDRVGIFADILNTLAAINIHIKKTKGKIIGKHNFEILIEIKPEDLDHLKTIIDKVKRIQDVHQVVIENK